MCLLLGVVNPVNSWFADSHENGVQISVTVGDLKLKVYQNALPTDAELKENPTQNEVFSEETNQDENTTNPQYISLGAEIKPDVAVPLTLILANKDEGAASIYVRFKLEVYVRGVSSDTMLEGVQVGFDTDSDGVLDTTSTSNFVYNNGYYNYQISGSNALFAKDTAETMFTHFTVPLSAFIDDSGDMQFKNSDTVYIKLTIQGDIKSDFSNSNI